MHDQYWSILGAVAYSTLTRPDIGVFVSALQRHNQKPKNIHAKRLNAVVRWAQRNPQKLHYKRLPMLSPGSSGQLKPGDKFMPHRGHQRARKNEVPSHLRQYGDAAFKKEELTGHSMRGSLYLRCPGHNNEDMVVTTKGHLLHFVNKQQRRVVRATFTAELLNGCDTQDLGFLLAVILHEMLTGLPSAEKARNFREHGGFALPMVLYIDALSVYAAVTALQIKIPADSSVLCYLQYLRELLEHLPRPVR